MQLGRLDEPGLRSCISSTGKLVALDCTQDRRLALAGQLVGTVAMTHPSRRKGNNFEREVSCGCFNNTALPSVALAIAKAWRAAFPSGATAEPSRSCCEAIFVAGN